MIEKDRGWEEIWRRIGYGKLELVEAAVGPEIIDLYIDQIGAEVCEGSRSDLDLQGSTLADEIGDGKGCADASLDYPSCHHDRVALIIFKIS